MNCQCPAPITCGADCPCVRLHGSCPEACSNRREVPGPRRHLIHPARVALGWIGVMVALVLLAATTRACEIKFGVDDRSQGPYAAGATVIFRLRVDLTHNNCPVDLKETKIQGQGLTILGATPWQNPSPNLWERRIKVTIAGAPVDGQVTLSAKRSCDKDGGWGVITVATAPTKA